MTIKANAGDSSSLKLNNAKQYEDSLTTLGGAGATITHNHNINISNTFKIILFSIEHTIDLPGFPAFTMNYKIFFNGVELYDYAANVDHYRPSNLVFFTQFQDSIVENANNLTVQVQFVVPIAWAGANHTTTARLNGFYL